MHILRMRKTDELTCQMQMKNLNCHSEMLSFDNLFSLASCSSWDFFFSLLNLMGDCAALKATRREPQPFTISIYIGEF